MTTEFSHKDLFPGPQMSEKAVTVDLTNAKRLWIQVAQIMLGMSCERENLVNKLLNADRL